MNVWFCAACGTPSGSLAERCLHCGAPRPGAQPGAEAPVTGPPATAPPETGPVPLAQYEVFAPQPEAYAPQPGAYAPPPEAFGPPQPGALGSPPPGALGPPPPGALGPPPPGAFGPPPQQHEAYVPPPAQPEALAPQAEAPPGFAGYPQQPPYDPNYRPAPAFVPAEGYGPPPAPPPGPRRRWWVPVLVVVVLLLATGAIATVLLVENDGGGDQAAAPDPTPTGVSSPTSRPTAAPTSSPTASGSPSAPPRLVTTDASVTDTRAAAVAAMFEDYFTAINDRDYDRALSAYDPAGVINPNDTRQANDFKQGIGTTTDSQIVLRSVGPPAGGRGVLDVRLTFRSNQQPGYGPKERPNEPCTAWDVTYALSQPAGEYKILIGRATHAPC